LRAITHSSPFLISLEGDYTLLLFLMGLEGDYTLLLFLISLEGDCTLLFPFLMSTLD
jgi:hypothetical protein